MTWHRLANRNVESLAKASEELTPAVAAVFAPLAAMALALGLWAFAAQIALAADFPISGGALSDWRVWILIAAALELCSLRFRSQSSGR
jgi:hypothetical protein